MGESIVDASNHEDEMGETAPSNPVLEVSVSFGRFANDSLSWEKWSSFSPNKYLEEVERCATPGSVAQKAAYFEAHYKKIAARKAELLDQEKQMEKDLLRSNDQTCGDLIADNSNTKSESDSSECQTSAEVVNQGTSLANEVCGTLFNEPSNDAAVTIGFPSSSIEERKEEAERKLESPMSDKSEEDVHVMVKEEVKNTSAGVQAVKKLQQKEMENTSTDIEENVNFDRSKESHMITLVNKERNITRAKKKPELAVSKPSSLAKASPTAKASPVTKASSMAKASPYSQGITIKAPQISAARVSKPTLASTPNYSSMSSARIGNSSSSSKSKNPSGGESKKLAPKSLHMSLSLGPSYHDPTSVTTTRKSLIMESMGDKDIVKRAFKTFQNRYNQLKSAGEDQSLAPKQVPAKGTEPRVSAFMTPRKENGGSFKVGDVEKKHGKAASSSLPMKRNESAEKRGEFPKKLEEKKSYAREANRTHLHTKSKENKGAEIKTVRQSPNVKATTMNSYTSWTKNN
ncbi:hypothetical protein Pint_23090 [Pistacia integerrima]|uniref:Uncharacterized protein n=1 Tax=Pistacia integerrima TaxID=434235 RepID=A0ACC0YIQ4_9ROSI|nr:hypothetical protein Pint_23090 [Pistacia integerrima]